MHAIGGHGSRVIVALLRREASGIAHWEPSQGAILATPARTRGTMAALGGRAGLVEPFEVGGAIGYRLTEAGRSAARRLEDAGAIPPDGGVARGEVADVTATIVTDDRILLRWRTAEAENHMWAGRDLAVPDHVYRRLHGGGNVVELSTATAANAAMAAKVVAAVIAGDLLARAEESREAGRRASIVRDRRRLAAQALGDRAHDLREALDEIVRDLSGRPDEVPGPVMRAASLLAAVDAEERRILSGTPA